ncbi:nitronate monooxygenase [Bdellovibrio bacteriovorus]|uniref:2-nitropropane dioxygenase n=1 Tax=Bdellovibrio bacteriovorus (strain ATCC 15356 / DSM 50701 / NCIMB 9529 / HD100) TaxID=264462 RepID=Q6ML62_BDEBA|nr:nitronate monooxygenase [Bdellovibrio bacteriovorus]AHZ84698.1 2-nitropropane dioxygenase [Bdellovibrio bacteriovorus]BEV68587.1 NADH:quinone reductase [Bdellovibrio bacteriovorus]CAE79995.1 2-nitropropane dioxygenase [Bdellovibrio bacteriovorus HD100]
MLKKIKTSFTDTMGINYPIIAAPMFLVSNTDIVVEASEAGGIGTFPALNYRPIEQYAEALKNIKSRTKKPIGVNVIVNKSNTRQGEDIKVALDHGVEMFITSLGSPKSVIQDAHKNGAKVFCDVTNLEHALKVQDMGADGVIAVGAGAGGHAGPISPLVLIPWLKTRLQIPIIAAGGIAHGSMISACLALGASGVSVGTRFIASREAQVDQSYKDAIVNSTPEDIVMTTRVSGTPAAVINTPYVQKMGTDLPWAMKVLKDYKLTKKYMVPLIHLMGMKSLEAAATKPTWKTVWTAGQSVGLVEEILTVKEIYAKLINEYDESVKSLSQLGLE